MTTKTITLTWVGLLLLTALSSVLTSPQVLSVELSVWELKPASLITYGLLALSAVKVRLVVMQFMEVDKLGSWLRVAFDTWLISLFLSLVIVYGMTG